MLKCPKRGCSGVLERRQTIHAEHPRMPAVYDGLNIIRRELFCPECKQTQKSVEMLERDLDLGGWLPPDANPRTVRP